jgi:acetyl-CoA synthetase
VPKAYVILAAGLHPGSEVARALLSFARDRLAPYKRVRRIEFVSELPKTISGKIRRGQLRGDEERRSPEFRGESEFREEDFSELRG